MWVSRDPLNTPTDSSGSIILTSFVCKLFLVVFRDTSGQGRFCTIFRSYSRGAQVRNPPLKWNKFKMTKAHLPYLCVCLSSGDPAGVWHHQPVVLRWDRQVDQRDWWGEARRRMDEVWWMLAELSWGRCHADGACWSPAVIVYSQKMLSCKMLTRTGLLEGEQDVSSGCRVVLRCCVVHLCVSPGVTAAGSPPEAAANVSVWFYLFAFRRQLFEKCSSL